MQGFNVKMDYHNIAPDAVIDNFMVGISSFLCHQATEDA